MFWCRINNCWTSGSGRFKWAHVLDVLVRSAGDDIKVALACGNLLVMTSIYVEISTGILFGTKCIRLHVNFEHLYAGGVQFYETLKGLRRPCVGHGVQNIENQTVAIIHGRHSLKSNIYAIRIARS